MKYSKENLELLIKECNNWSELENKLQIKNGNSRDFINNKILNYNIDISHFKNYNINPYYRITNEDLFKCDSNEPRGKIRLRVIKKKLIPYVCECCGQDENWQGKIMPLVLDHKNGINNDHRLQNLRFLCSNCDSIQDTYKSKNKKKSSNKKDINNLQDSNLVRIEKCKNEILNFDVDYKITGWRNKISEKMNWTPQYSGKFIKNHIPELWEICKKHRF